MDDLAALEERVRQKYLDAVGADNPAFAAFDWSAWLAEVTVLEPLPPGTPPFPREQWVTWPNRRTIGLLIADHAIDRGLLSEAGFLLAYAGRERVARSGRSWPSCTTLTAAM